MRNRLNLGTAIAVTAAAACGCSPAGDSTKRSEGAPPPGAYLFVWAGDADEKDSDFLAVVDSRPGSKTYGEVVATLPVGARATMPHHVDYESPPDNMLFVNGWKAGHSFIVDVRDPTRPKLAAQFKSVSGYSFPHSFARLANGNALAVFQSKGERYAPEGGLVELDMSGRGVRAGSAATPDVPAKLNWPYSLAVHPSLDRVITTSTDMGMPPFEKWQYNDTRHVQVWSKSDLRLLSSVALPPAPQGRHHIWPAEPRVLADGTVYVNTFTCGLYRLDGLDTAKPEATFVHAFPGGTSLHDMCFVPVVYGKYWLQTVPALPGIVVLDVSDPKKPVEASRFKLDPSYHMPHWLAADRSSGRLVLTGDSGSWVLLLRLDPQTGLVRVDESFRKAGSATPGISFDRAKWPHGETGKAVVHGAVFSS